MYVCMFTYDTHVPQTVLALEGFLSLTPEINTIVCVPGAEGKGTTVRNSNVAIGGSISSSSINSFSLAMNSQGGVGVS